MSFKQTHQTPAQIARQLGVDALVTGTVMRSPDRVRVSTQVIQIDPERNLWADRYERPRADIVNVEGTLARQISDAIRVTLTPQEEHRVGQARDVDEEAREAYLKGEYYLNKRTEEATGRRSAMPCQTPARGPQLNSVSPRSFGVSDSRHDVAAASTAMATRSREIVIGPGSRQPNSKQIPLLRFPRVRIALTGPAWRDTRFAYLSCTRQVEQIVGRWRYRRCPDW